MPTARFKYPPITEVACGVLFEELGGLDPVDLGIFWQRQREAFPRKQLLPAILTSPESFPFELAPLPRLRTWLISSDDTRVMQVQNDRFYLNWRRVADSPYPSFNVAGGQRGLLREVLEAFSGFNAFITSHHGRPVKPLSIEMTMIDLLRADRHWSDVRDLVQLLPSLKALTTGMSAMPEMFKTVVEGRIESGSQRIVMTKVKVIPEGVDAIQVESTIRLGLPTPERLEASLDEAHKKLKQVFDELVPVAEHWRFDEVRAMGGL